MKGEEDVYLGGGTVRDSGDLSCPSSLPPGARKICCPLFSGIPCLLPLPPMLSLDWDTGWAWPLRLGQLW